MKTQRLRPQSVEGESERTSCLRGHATEADHERQLLKRLSRIGLDVVHDARAPVPLLTFGKRVLARLQPEAEALPLPYFADALKRVIGEMHHEHLHVLSPAESFGVGYVYDARDPETWPIRLIY